MASVSVEDVTKRYKAGSQYCNLEGVDFAVSDGEFFCLIGPSGSGKTSTLRLIAGLDDPDTGTVQYDGEPVLDVPANERGASLLFESLALYPNRTGFENIVHPLEVQGMEVEERRRRVEELAEVMGISHLLDRTPETFSGGEKQRVGIARSIIKDATVHLLDEPLQGLDAKLKKQMRVELNRLQREVGETFVYATNDQEIAMSIADRIAVMRDGRVEQIGTPVELYDEPVNRFVAKFIGSPSINFVDATIQGDELTAGPVTFANDHRLDEYAGSWVAGIRPHDIEITRDVDASPFKGTIDIVEPLGGETIVDIGADGVTLRVSTREPYAPDLDAGDEIGFTVDYSDLYVFDESGRTEVSPVR
jgi:multiple sugar transport system ATP-binding protein